MLATLLLELGLPDAPHRDCLRFRSVVPGFIAEVFGRNGVDFEGVRPMGSLHRLAFLVEGIPTLTNTVSGWVAGPMERVGRTVDGHLTPVTEQFLQRHNKQASDLEVRDVDGARRLGVHVHRKPVLAATVLPAALAELMEVIAASERSRVSKGVDFADALQWIVALLGDARVRFKWRNLESDRYTYTGSKTGQRVLVPHFYEYHAVLAQAGIRVDEATRRDHLRRELNAVASDFGGRCVLTGDQLEQLSLRLDEPSVHLHRGLPLELGPRFVQALAFASTYCVAVRRDDGGLAPGWLVVSERTSTPAEEDGNSESETAHRAFSRVVEDAGAWLKGKIDSKAKRQAMLNAAPFVEYVSRVADVGAPDVAAMTEAIWYCKEAEATLASTLFSGTHLWLAHQRASNKRASKRVLELLDGLATISAGSADGTPKSDPGVALLSLVMMFHDLVHGFETNRAPMAERDPLALRRRVDNAFDVLVENRWALPMEETVGRAVGTWSESPTTTAGALIGFLRHRAGRYLNRLADGKVPRQASAPPLSGEWSIVDLL